ncbi:hypothetical protein ACWEQ4_00760 [Rhodococcus sp. NPDC003994]
MASKRFANKDLRNIAKAAVEQGFEVQVTSRGHVRLLKDGVPVSTFAGTPSDRRSWLNSLSHAKRAGFTPP